MTTPSAAESSLCLASECGHLPAPGILLCTRHETNLSTWVTQLGVEYERLSAVPSMQGREPGAIGSSGLASHRSPARLDVLTLTDRRTAGLSDAPETSSYHRVDPRSIGPWCLLCDHDTCVAWRAGRQRDQYDDEAAAGSHRLLSAFGVLNGWADQVRGDCPRYKAPETPQPLTVLGERRVLAAHLEWILTQDWVGIFHGEMAVLWQRIQAANGATRRVGWPCACGGRIRWGNGAAQCGSCGTRVSAVDAVRKVQEEVA